MLDNAGDGLGEPLNIIISGESSPEVLVYAGFYNFAQAIGFSEECFGLHLGGPFSANVGDGNVLFFLIRCSECCMVDIDQHEND